LTIDVPTGDMDTLKQFAENEKKQRIEAEKELHLQVYNIIVVNEMNKN